MTVHGKWNFWEIYFVLMGATDRALMFSWLQSKPRACNTAVHCQSFVTRLCLVLRTSKTGCYEDFIWRLLVWSYNVLTGRRHFKPPVTSSSSCFLRSMSQLVGRPSLVANLSNGQDSLCASSCFSQNLSVVIPAAAWLSPMFKEPFIMNYQIFH